MGISGLIPFLEKASCKINLKDLKGCTVAVDTYCWLHKGAYGCADKLIRGDKTDFHIIYCMKFVNMLLSFNIKPILVFDGMHLPAKSLTEDRRRNVRHQAKKLAAELLRLGKIEEAKVQMRRGIDITHDMVTELIQLCRQKKVDCIVAPYEADAQLAYLTKKNIAQYVITEDSDLSLFGTKKIIFKLDLTGNCLLVESDKFHLAMGCKLERYTFDKFLNMCILSGCDYLDSLPGIGLVKACKFMLKTEETDMKRALKKIPQYLNMKNLNVSDDYIECFLKAQATFKHMYVFDPCQRKMVRLNEIPDNMENSEFLCSNAGSLLDDETAFKLALGNLNPFTLKEVDSWNPDVDYQKNIGKQSVKSSIWDRNFAPKNIKKQTSLNAFTFKKVNYSITDAESGENEIIDEYSVISQYSNNQPPSKKPKMSEEFEDDISDTSDTQETVQRHNPFAKESPETKNIQKASNINSQNSVEVSKFKRLSSFNRTVVDDTKEVRSRFFLSNRILVQNNNDLLKIQQKSEVEINTQNVLITGDKSETTSLENEFSQESNEKSDCIESSSNLTPESSVELSQVDRIDVIEISDGEDVIEQKIRQILPKVTIKKSLKKLEQKKSDSQTRLSMFGFKKRATLQK